MTCTGVLATKFLCLALWPHPTETSARTRGCLGGNDDCFASSFCSMLFQLNCELRHS